jgi:hypothetical protein
MFIAFVEAPSNVWIEIVVRIKMSLAPTLPVSPLTIYSRLAMPTAVGSTAVHASVRDG